MKKRIKPPAHDVYSQPEVCITETDFGFLVSLINETGEVVVATFSGGITPGLRAKAYVRMLWNSLDRLPRIPK